MKAKLIIITIALLSIGSLNAQLVLTSLDTITVDFSNFDGTGFQPGGSDGTLDSDHWKTLGLSDGASSFGGTFFGGDFGRGSNAGGTSTGGFYEWDVAGDGSVSAPGWQPTAGDATPGNLVLWLRNNNAEPIGGFTVSFDRWVNNDQERASSLDFGYATSEPLDASDAGTVIDTFTTPETSDALGFHMNPSGPIAINQSVGAGEDLFLIWSTDDALGSGSRDEFGISNLQITPVPEPKEYAFALGFGLIGYGLYRRSRIQHASL